MAGEQVIDVKRIGISRVKDPRLRISGLPDSVRKRKERQKKYNPRGIDDLPVDHDLCYGFDFDRSLRPYKLVKSLWGDAYDIQIFGRLGLCCYNFQQGTNLKFVRWEKYNIKPTSTINFYVTLEAMDPALHSLFSFQTLFSYTRPRVGISLKWSTFAGRIKCNEAVYNYWIESDNAIDDFYKGDMPKWVSDEDLAAGNNKYYVLQESELHENEWWLHLFAEIAFYSKQGSTLRAAPRLEIKRALVETREEARREPLEKLKAGNAIFYISYKYNGDPSTGLAGDHKAIIRKTMDGYPGHMCLEVAE
ncbi:hypothetical protein V5N11_006979 [Cardamine amara subsp. amara]|uniref:Uncharacterized protein n=1 Tax=Cardamine amara subsp. amara TaxID=228776 RepID=A0ABD1AWY4_CARAN